MLLLRAIDTWGVSAQLNQVQEECAELIVAINKCRRAGVVQDKVIICNKQSEKGNRAIFDLIGEIADVKIMIAQLELLVDPVYLDHKIGTKMERLEMRLDGKAV